MVAPVVPESRDEAEQDEADNLDRIFNAVEPIVIGSFQQRIDDIHHMDQRQNAENHLRREMK